MYIRVLVNKYTAISQLLRVLLANTLSCAIDNRNFECISQENIHLYKSRDLNRILYISGIALQQKKSQNLHSMKFAQKVGLYLSAKYGQELKVEIVSPGLIYIELTPVLLADWLQRSVSRGIQHETQYNKSKNKSKSCHNIYLSREFVVTNPRDSFALQYVYARCCSLIRLAAREKLIELEENNAVGSVSRVVVKPLPIPWLEDNRQLRLLHSTELHLMSKLIKTVDDLECGALKQTPEWEKIALGLSQNFTDFWSDCRIWGEVKSTNRELAQARIGLIMLARLVFERLLEEKLGLIAPQEL